LPLGAAVCFGLLDFAQKMACPTGSSHHRLWVFGIPLVFAVVLFGALGLLGFRHAAPRLLDAVILLSRLPQATCVMKATLKGNILFGPLARFSGYIGNEDPLKLIRQACTELAEGAHVLIFPEGTRTLKFPVNTFGQTAALIAQRSGVPIQTLLISFSTPYLGKRWPLYRKPRLPLHISVQLGQRFDVVTDKEMLTQKLETYYRQHLNY
jgi:1-acyl-sn-glycerol-3-phosphate acyltransferase